MLEKHGLGLKSGCLLCVTNQHRLKQFPCLFFPPSTTYRSLLWQSNVLYATCKPHPTEEALWSCPPCCLPSHSGSSYHYYLPCQTINIAPKYNTRGFSHHSNSAHFSVDLSPKIEFGISVLVAYLYYFTLETFSLTKVELNIACLKILKKILKS